MVRVGVGVPDLRQADAAGVGVGHDLVGGGPVHDRGVARRAVDDEPREVVLRGGDGVDLDLSAAGEEGLRRAGHDVHGTVYLGRIFAAYGGGRGAPTGTADEVPDRVRWGFVCDPWPC